MEILNFFVVYLIVGFVITKLIFSSFKSYVDRSIIFLIGYGLGPFLVSLVYLYLYLLFPSRSADFYIRVFYVVLLGMLFLIIDKVNFSIHPFLRCLKDTLDTFKKLSFYSKVLSIYILFVLFFVFIRGFTFPTTSGDALKYLEQGRAIAETRNLQSYYTSQDLLKSGGFQFIQGIRPALPILYSQFYLNTDNLTMSEFSSRFVHFYYFLLLLILFVYIVQAKSMRNDFIVYGLAMLVSSFSFIRYLIRPNYKEIILAFCALLWLYLVSRKDIFFRKGSVFVILTGSIFGWMMFINYGGFVLTSIVFAVFLLINRRYITKSIKFIVATALVTIPLSGGEALRAWMFIFRPTQLNVENRFNTFSSQEIINYKILESIPSNISDTKIRLIILFKTKLDFLTQPYVHGFIFWIFTLLLIVLIKKRHRILPNKFLTVLVSFITLYILIYKDPLFLNPHRFAYVLSISEKFVGFLVPFVAIFVVINYEHIIDTFSKIKQKYLYLTYMLLLFLIPAVRNSVADEIFVPLSSIIRIYRSKEYYVSAIGRLLMVLSLSFVLFVTLFIVGFKKKSRKTKAYFLNFMFLVAVFILPFLYSLNTNYYIRDTLTHTFSSRSQKILAMGRTAQEDDIYNLIYYLREDVEAGRSVLVVTSRYHDQIEHFLRDYHKLAFIENSQNVKEHDYSNILADDTAMPLIQNILSDYSVVKRRGEYFLLERTEN
jgi:hypothetical protein